MGKVYGIDLGTTYSVIATVDENGTPEVIENYSDSSDLLASAVYFPEGADPVVGEVAKNQAVMEPDKVVQWVKRQIGEPDAQTWPFNGEQYNPVTISSLILKRMKEYAEEQGHVLNDADVVITCPAYFKIPHRNATRLAGEIAGLKVKDIINEPTAAALNYCSREFPENKKILVYDLGGGTFDVSVIQFTVNEETKKAFVKELRSDGNKRRGGIDWDERLFEHMAEKYLSENGIDRQDMDTTLKQAIRKEVEGVKIRLSKLQSTSCDISYKGDSTRFEVTRETFNGLTSDLVTETMDYVENVLKAANLEEKDIDVVLLVGGSTMMPMIQEAVRKMFSDKVKVERPNLAVALGAAIAAAIEVEDFEHQDPDQEQDPNPGTTPVGGHGKTGVGKGSIGGVIPILPSSFGPAIFNAKDEWVIDNLLFKGDESPAESPAEASEIYGSMVDGQSEIVIPIYENASEDRENRYVKPSRDENGNEQYTDPNLEVTYLDEISIPLPPNTPKGYPVEVKFSCSAKGLDVLVTEQKTGKSYPLFISFGGMTEEEVSKEKERFKGVKTRGDK